MSFTLRFLVLLVPTMAIVAAVFNGLMSDLETRWAKSDLYSRATLIHDSVRDSIQSKISTGDLDGLHQIYRRVERQNEGVRFLICSPTNEIISRSPKVDQKCEWDLSRGFNDLTAQEFSGMQSKSNKERTHQSFFVIGEAPQIRGYLVIFQDASFRIERSSLVQKYTLYAFIALAVFISLLTLGVYRWSHTETAQQFGQALKGVVIGQQDLDESLDSLKRKRLQQTQSAQEDERIWGPARLSRRIEELFQDSPICILSTEEPVIHNHQGSKITAKTPASGLVSAIEPLARASSGLWIGRGTGTADHQTADRLGHVMVPVEDPEYALKRVWLTRQEEERFYHGFSNEGLWPLCHHAHVRPQFRAEDWSTYVDVNGKFASAFNEEIKSSRPVVFIQNYQLALVPSILRKIRPDALTTLFWHIPWPSSRAMRTCPWRKEILEGMLGADLIGFQLLSYCNQFLETVDRTLEAKVKRDEYSVTYQGRTTFVKPFPSSIDWHRAQERVAPGHQANRHQVLENYSIDSERMIVGLGIDRLDYTKGILERLKTIEKVLDLYPDLIGKLVFIQAAAPTYRMHLPSYQDLNAKIQSEVDRINWRFAQDAYRPIILDLHHREPEEVIHLYQAADFTYISSLDDGMNLTAKEFVAARTDLRGVLVLSEFAGAAQELKDALIVNPYDTEGAAQAIFQATQMSLAEQERRMAQMRETVQVFNAHHWASRYIGELQKINHRSSQN